MYSPVYFNAVNLETVPGLQIMAIDTLRSPERKLSVFENAQANRSAVTSAWFKQRKIRVSCEIGRDSKANLESSLRELDRILQGINKELKLTQAGVDTTYYDVSRSAINIDKYAGGYADIDIEFIAANPTAYNTSATTLYNYASLVGGAYSFAVDFSGNIEQQPSITYTLTSGIGLTNRTVSFTNPATGMGVSITRDWTAGDAFIIHGRLGVVFINGFNSVEYDGIVTEWATGMGAIVYADDFDHRNVAISITNQTRYI